MTGDDKANELPPLEVLCDHCEGDAGDYWNTDEPRCLKCHGAGYIPTEAGEQVLALLRHNLRLRSGELGWRNQ